MIRDISMFNHTPCYNGTDFEHYTAKWLRQLGISANTTASDDGGVDVVATLVIEGITYKFYIQCKFQCKTLGTQPVHEVYSGASLYGVDGKPVIWTNSRVSSSARTKVQKLGVEIIGDAEIKEINSTISSKHLGNRTGLLGIIEGIITENAPYVQQCAKGLTRAMRRKEDNKEKIISLFELAKMHSQEAERLHQEAAKQTQLALELQKEALLKNLDYG